MADSDVELGEELAGRGDFAGAAAAFGRAGARGNLEGTYLMAHMLKRTGDLAGAEAAFRTVGEQGVPLGWTGYGVLLQDRGDTTAAEQAYRKATGDKDAAFNLGDMLMRQGRVAEAVAALREAEALGHPMAPIVRAAIEEQLGGLYQVEKYLDVLSEQRAKLAAVWEAHYTPTVRFEAGIAMLDETIEHRNRVLRELLGRSPEFYYRPERGGGTSAGAGRILTVDPVTEKADGTYEVSEELRRRMTQEMAGASHALFEARGKLLGGRYKNEARQHLDTYVRLLGMLENRRTRMQRDRDAARARMTEVAQARVAAQSAVDAAAEPADEAERNLPATLRPWSDPVWDTAWKEQAGLGSAALYLGRQRPLPDPRLGDNADFGTDRDRPVAVEPRHHLHFAHDAGQRAAVHALVRSTLLRALVSAEPGNVRLTFFDPIGLGQSVSSLLELAEYDPELIGGKVWSSAADLTSRLAEHTAHIELVIQKYLKSTYATIDDFNEAAGEVAEPYRYLVLFDFPSGFTEQTSRELVRILENGPRCGVRVVLVSNVAIEIPYGVAMKAVDAALPPVSLARNLERRTGGYVLASRLETDSDEAAPAGLIRAIVDHVGRRAASRSEAVVTFDGVFGLFRDAAARGITAGLPAAAAGVTSTDPRTWWAGSTADAAVAPIGRTGAREVASLAFDSGNHAGALLVGRPGSGKSTLLHSYLAGLTTLYGPDELELYLIDFKEGVEFQAYARQALPHARCVAIESDREFGLSVLQSLEAELKRRGDRLRSSGGQHSGLTALRHATGEVIPRVLLVFDEFHVLFARNDKVGLAAAALLETLVRQGRSFGIHLLLGSQSLAGLDALGAHVPQLLPTRILLPATEGDARKVLGEGNDAGQYLTRHGEGILNTAGGAVEANQRFRGAFESEGERRDRLGRLRAKADAAGFTRRPVVFEGNAAIPIESVSPARFGAEVRTSGRQPLRLRVGAPMTISGAADVELAREPGGNVLVVARDDVPRAQLALVAASLAVSPARIDVVDFMAIDDGVDEILAPLADRGRLRVHRRRGLGRLLGELREQVRERVATDDVGAPPRALLLYGLHRARDLDAMGGGVDADPELLDALEEIVRDGPEVGVHTWAWSETAAGLQRRLPGSVVREFGWRIAGRQSADDSQRLIGTEEAAELRDRQVVLVNDDRGLSRRCTSYTIPPAAWLAEVLDRSEHA
jgi:DNA segregation ATPase FtsK/SpoIIIE, S-DNA-T family